MTSVKSYSELRRFDSFEDRFEYLKLGGSIGQATFGFDRWLNQRFYQSEAWKHTRRAVILRDKGCDLGVEGHEINGAALVHHMNPMSPDDIKHGEEWILNPEFLIMTCKDTHNAIHYGDESLLPKPIVERRPNDTKLW